MKEFEREFDEVHKLLSKRNEKMPDHIKREIIDEMFSGEKKLAEKMTFENKKNSMFKVLKKYVK